MRCYFLGKGEGTLLRMSVELPGMVAWRRDIDEVMVSSICRKGRDVKELVGPRHISRPKAPSVPSLRQIHQLN